MNSVPVTAEPEWGISLGVLVLIGFMAVLVIAASGRRFPEIARTLAKIGVVGVGFLVILGFVWTVPVQQVRRENPYAAESRLIRSSETRASASASPAVTVELESAKPGVELPEWTRQSARIDGNRKLIVVSSGRFASEEEANLHGIQTAAASAAKEYSSLDPRGIGAAQPRHMDLVKDTAIKQRFLEIAQHDFGKFQAPMYQLWMQVELTPELGERLAEPWRQAAVEARLRTLAGWGLWCTAAAALAAFALRLDAAWNGRRRAVLVGATIALAVGGLAFLA